MNAARASLLTAGVVKANEVERVNVMGPKGQLRFGVPFQMLPMRACVHAPPCWGS